MASPPALQVQGLRKRYGTTTVLDGVDFHVEPGECLGLLGPNGAGKTTTLKLALGLGRADAGEVWLLGYRMPEQARAARERVGVIPQFDNLDPDFSCVENLRVFGRYFGMSEAALDRRLPWLMEFAGLEGREASRINALSGGMRRRLTMARALVNDPELVFMDEPTTGLDPQARHMVWERLRRLRAEGKTLVLTSHFMEEAERLCTRLLVMDHGRVIACGSPRELIAAHIEPQVVEVHGAGLSEWVERMRLFVPRMEVSGDTAFCYANEVTPLMEGLSRQTALSFLHRPANLEDVFLKLTGRDLRDA